MPKSVQAKEEEEVEEQTLNSPTDEDVAEEEFEIERILAYEPNRFISEQTKKRIGGFYVKWKGYTSDDNSWVSVEDCHAEDLINKFWEQHPEQRPKPKGPKGGKGKFPSLEVVSAKSKSRSRHEDAMEVDSGDEAPRKKARLTKDSKPVTSSSTNARTNDKSLSRLERETTESADDRGSAHPHSTPDNQPQKIQRLDTMDINDFRAKVQKVDTVEMSHGKMFYFLTLKDGSGGAAPSAYIRKTVPEIAIDFFEKNVKWKEDPDRE